MITDLFNTHEDYERNTMPINEKLIDVFMNFCFTSYVFDDLYLSTKFMKEMSIKEGDIVKLISSAGSTIVKVFNKSKWDISKEQSDGLPFNVSYLETVKRDSDAIILGVIPFYKISTVTSKGSRYIAFENFNIKPDCRPAESISITTKQDVKQAELYKTHWKDEFSLITEIGDMRPLFMSTKKIQDLITSLENTKDLTKVYSIGVVTQAFLRALKIRNYRDLIEISQDKLMTVRGLGEKRSYSVLFSASNCIGLFDEFIEGRVTETIPADSHVYIDNNTKIVLKRPYYARLSVKGHPKISMQCIPALNEWFKLESVHENLIELMDEYGRFIIISDLWASIQIPQ